MIKERIIGIINSKKHYINVLAIYSIISISQFFVDILITSKYSHDIVTFWASYKANVLIISSLILLGVNVAYFRYAKELNWKRFFGVHSVQIFLLGFLITLILYILNIFDFFTITSFIIILLGLSILIACYYQHTKKYIISLLIQGGWRIVLILLILFDLQLKYVNTSYHLSILFLLSFPIVIYYFFKNFSIKSLFNALRNSEDYSYIKVSGIFFLAAITLSFSSYIDQSLLLLVKSEELASTYFAHISVFLIPFIFANKLTGYIFLPTLSNMDKQHITKKFLLKYLYLFLLYGAILFLINLIIGSSVFSLIYKDKYSFNLAFVAMISIIGVLRSIYTFSSCTTPIVCKEKDLIYLIVFYFIGIIFEIGIILIFQTSTYIIYFFLVAVFMNWLIRIVSSLYYVFKSDNFIKPQTIKVGEMNPVI